MLSGRFVLCRLFVSVCVCVCVGVGVLFVVCSLVGRFSLFFFFFLFGRGLVFAVWAGR